MSLKLAAAAAISMAVIGTGAGVAIAYPPGTAPTVMATRIPVTAHHTIRVLVSASNLDPRCEAFFVMDGVKAQVHVSKSGTATVTLERPAIDGGKRLVINVRTGAGDKGCTVETGHAKVDSQPAHLEGPAKVKLYQSFTINAENWPPNVAVTCRAVLDGYTKNQPVRTATTDKYGNAYFYGFWLPRKGNWAIGCSGGEEMHTWWVVVD